jgi:hypothetical protein
MKEFIVIEIATLLKEIQRQEEEWKKDVITELHKFIKEEW